MSREITLKVSDDNEGTSSPWWIIIDPRQNFNTNNQGLHNIAHMITGPFFSRETAQKHLDCRRYAFSKNAAVYCHSGYWSNEYSEAIKEATSDNQNRQPMARSECYERW